MSEFEPEAQARPAQTRPRALPRAALLWGGAAAVLCLTVYTLGFMTVRSMDDYYYTTFWNEGFSGFVRCMSEHYATMNGRTLIHTLVSALMQAGTAVFGLLAAASAVALPLLGRRLMEKECSPLPALAAFLGGVLFLPRDMMVQGVLWRSAFGNYVLPTVLVVLLFYLLRRGTAARTLRPLAAVGTAVCALACGATTEQSGLLAVCVALAVCAQCVADRSKRLWLPLVCAAASAAGLATIFLSPATQKRFLDEHCDSTWEALLGGLHTQSEFFHEYRTLQILLALAAAVLAAYIWLRLGNKAAGAGFAAVTLGTVGTLALGSGAEVLFAAHVVLLAALLAQGAFLWWKKERCLGVLLALAVGSILIIAATNSSAPRTLTPFYLYVLLAVTCALGALCVGREKRLGCIGAAALTLLGAAYICRHMPYYVQNYRTERRNLAAEREARITNVLWYDVRYNEDYAYGQPYSNPFPYRYYRASAKLREDCTLYFYHPDLPRVFVNGTMLELPASFGENGETLLPLRQITEALGGTVDWTSKLTAVRLNGREALLVFDVKTLHISWTDDLGAAQSRVTPYDLRFYATYLPADLFRDIFSLSVTQDAEGFHISQ